jgi:hypothetical protein
MPGALACPLCTLARLSPLVGDMGGLNTCDPSTEPAGRMAQVRGAGTSSVAVVLTAAGSAF